MLQRHGRVRRAVTELLRANPRTTTAPSRSREDDYPAGFPNGWYRVASSEDVKPGGVVRVDCLGQQLVVYRGNDHDAVTVADAHCPHQGADLGVGGIVKDNCLRCPFHHWSFDRHGDVCDVPALDKPPRISLRTWPVVERYGSIFTYYDAANPRAAPPYELARHEDILSGELVYRGQYRPDDVDMHLIEFAENSVDFQHFKPLHGNMLIPWTQTRIPFMTVRHDPSWEIDAQEPHIAYFHNNACLTLFDRVIPRSDASATITLFGPGGLVWFRFNIPEFGDLVLFQTHTPLEPMRQEVRFRWYANPKIPRALVAYVVGSWISNWRADITIWENKIYRRKPMLCKADGPVARMRRWFDQFYATA